ncbi:hypothetical protein NDU88_007152 [Pleurodeles waltl]|uniref:Uncharacterized protein n=1 Tax=Pleurodeles waltl TaxID=8319 RepID=A0AAV7TZ84_PLEWA|nr:hypothetical protein NDU88_007152 [Pleurodeles waltl]
MRGATRAPCPCLPGGWSVSPAHGDRSDSTAAARCRGLRAVLTHGHSERKGAGAGARGKCRLWPARWRRLRAYSGDPWCTRLT